MSFLTTTIENRDIRKISETVEGGNRISAEDALLLNQMGNCATWGLATR